MRTSILAAFLGLTLVACVGSVPGDPGGGGTAGGGGAAGGGGVAGGGGGGGGGDELDAFVPPPVPAVAITVDHTTVTTDLNVTAKVVVTATGSMGFSGPVTLAISAVGSDGTTVLADWKPTIDNTALTLTENGTATANISLNLAGDVDELLGSIKIAATSSAAESDADVAVTANPVMDVSFVDNASGTCTYFAQNPAQYTIKVGRQIAVYNASTTGRGLIVHAGGVPGFPHENVGGTPTAVGQAYINMITGTAQNVPFGCHQTGNTMADGNTNDYPQLTAVQ
jgi:hypothetical protein